MFQIIALNIWAILKEIHNSDEWMIILQFNQSFYIKTNLICMFNPC